MRIREGEKEKEIRRGKPKTPAWELIAILSIIIYALLYWVIPLADSNVIS